MSTTELIPLVQALQHTEKLKLMAFLLEEIAREDGVRLQSISALEKRAETATQQNPLQSLLESDFIGCFEAEPNLSVNYKPALMNQHNVYHTKNSPTST